MRHHTELHLPCDRLYAPWTGGVSPHIVNNSRPTASTGLCFGMHMLLDHHNQHTKAQSPGSEHAHANSIDSPKIHQLGEFLLTLSPVARATGHAMHSHSLFGTHMDPFYQPRLPESGSVISTLSLSDLTRAEFGQKAPKKTLSHPKIKSFLKLTKITLYGFSIIVVLGQIPPQVLYGG